MVTYNNDAKGVNINEKRKVYDDRFNGFTYDFSWMSIK